MKKEVVHEESLQGGQPYDTTIKAMLKEDAGQMVPLFVPGATVLDTLDIEIIQSTLRTDRVYRVMHEDERSIVQLEVQAGVDEKMVQRLLVYHASLWYDYSCPIISIVVYLFRCKVPTSPFREKSAQKELLTFHFEVVGMWQQDARIYFKIGALSMHPLLPTMEHATAGLLLQAIEELIQYYQNDVEMLRRRLLWMKIFLGRTTTVKKADKERVMERLDTFEQLFEQDEFVRRQRALGRHEGKEEGRAEGEIKGKLEEARKIVLTICQIRFPKLYVFTEPKVAQTEQVETLNKVIELLITATDEAGARAVLEAKLGPQQS